MQDMLQAMAVTRTAERKTEVILLQLHEKAGSAGTSPYCRGPEAAEQWLGAAATPYAISWVANSQIGVDSANCSVIVLYNTYSLPHQYGGGMYHKIKNTFMGLAVSVFIIGASFSVGHPPMPQPAASGLDTPGIVAQVDSLQLLRKRNRGMRSQLSMPFFSFAPLLPRRES